MTYAQLSSFVCTSFLPSLLPIEAVSTASGFHMLPSSYLIYCLFLKGT